MDFVELSRRVGRDDGVVSPDPHSTLSWLRMNSPVSRLPDPGSGRCAAWLVTSYRLARDCLVDRRLSFDPRNAGVAWHAPGHSPYVLAKDAPEHTSLRQIFIDSYRPGALHRMRAPIVAICEEAIGSLVGRRRVDLLADYALPVTEMVTQEFFGIPQDERMAPGRASELSIVIALSEQYAGGPATDEMHEYIARIVARRRDSRGEDIISAALSAVDRGAVTKENALGMLYLLFTTGQLSTAPMIAAAAVRTLQHVQQASERMHDPNLWPELINEVLRYDSPVQTAMPRFALEDLTIGGKQIAKGDAVFVSIAAANRDPEKYAAPDEFRLNRRSAPHIGFGSGAHFCIGAPLARLEAEIALDMLLSRLPTLRLTLPVEDLTWTLGPMLRCPREAPAEFLSAQELDDVVRS
jgi:cytochrome P450